MSIVDGLVLATAWAFRVVSVIVLVLAVPILKAPLGWFDGIAPDAAGALDAEDASAPPWSVKAPLSPPPESHELRLCLTDFHCNITLISVTVPLFGASIEVRHRRKPDEVVVATLMPPTSQGTVPAAGTFQWSVLTKGTSSHAAAGSHRPSSLALVDAGLAATPATTSCSRWSRVDTAIATRKASSPLSDELQRSTTQMLSNMCLQAAKTSSIFHLFLSSLVPPSVAANVSYSLPLIHIPGVSFCSFVAASERWPILFAIRWGVAAWLPDVARPVAVALLLLTVAQLVGWDAFRDAQAWPGLIGVVAARCWLLLALAAVSVHALLARKMASTSDEAVTLLLLTFVSWATFLWAAVVFSSLVAIRHLQWLVQRLQVAGRLIEAFSSRRARGAVFVAAALIALESNGDWGEKIGLAAFAPIASDSSSTSRREMTIRSEHGRLEDSTPTVRLCRLRESGDDEYFLLTHRQQPSPDAVDGADDTVFRWTLTMSSSRLLGNWETVSLAEFHSKRAKRTSQHSATSRLSCSPALPIEGFDAQATSEAVRAHVLQRCDLRRFNDLAEELLKRATNAFPTQRGGTEDDDSSSVRRDIQGSGELLHATLRDLAPDCAARLVGMPRDSIFYFGAEWPSSVEVAASLRRSYPLRLWQHKQRLHERTYALALKICLGLAAWMAVGYPFSSPSSAGLLDVFLHSSVFGCLLSILITRACFWIAVVSSPAAVDHLMFNNPSFASGRLPLSEATTSDWVDAIDRHILWTDRCALAVNWALALVLLRGALWFLRDVARSVAGRFH